MTKVISCPCGYVVRADSEDGLIAKAQQHAKEVHGMELTHEQAQAMIQPA